MTAPKTRTRAPQKTGEQPVHPRHGQLVNEVILAEHPEWAYLFTGEQARPATETEAAEYARRASDPNWADLYDPAEVSYDQVGATA